MSKKLTLQSCDGDFFEIDENVALQSQTLANMIEDDCVLSAIPIAEIDSEILALVIEYCKKHAEINEEEEEVKKWDTEFVQRDLTTLFKILNASNFLAIKSLLNLISQAIADLIKDKTVEEVRTIFSIVNDFSPEEEEALRKDNRWAFN